MKLVFFYHSLVSDWNHGNAHFLRGVVWELIQRGHEVVVYEPQQGWSLGNLLAESGKAPLEAFKRVYPGLESRQYELESLDLERVSDGADLVMVHEWNEPILVKRIGEHRAKNPHYRLLFHDTHHRSVSDRNSIHAYDLSHYDGVLAFGNIIRDIYLQEGWAKNAWTWHEAADTRLFKPIENTTNEGDLVWIGNWGDDERTAELFEFLIHPISELQLKAKIHGVRYPETAISALREARIDYGGWLPNFAVPQVFAQYKVTVHVPRRYYAQSLPGIPTIRVFEALACGIPLISAPWEDTEGLFTPGQDFLIAQNGQEMKRHLRDLLQDESMRETLATQGLKTILQRHTCQHRVDELLQIYAELGTSKRVTV